MIATFEINFASEILTLTNQRAIFWKKEQILILSDTHIGKTAHFRKRGIAIPDTILEKDLLRLQQLIEHYKPKKIIVVGDLFHAENNKNIAVFKNWLFLFSTIEWLLIRGNHDRFSVEFYSEFNFNVVKQLQINTINFIHEPNHTHNANFSISGHTHPGVKLKLPARQVVKLPCYHITNNTLILPAFSQFTGLNVENQNKNDLLFPFTDTDIWHLKK